MSIPRTLVLIIAVIFANIFDIASSDSAGAETRWCRIIMGKCFVMDKGDWVELPMKPNASFGITGTNSKPATRPAVGRSKSAKRL